jgi:hypothetical protein
MAAAQDGPDLVTIITSPEPQTQLMALVLTFQAAQQGANAHIMLCGPAGDIALNDAPESATAGQPPRDMSPQGLMQMIRAQTGATVEVCAIYLPGRGEDPSVLLDGSRRGRTRRDGRAPHGCRYPCPELLIVARRTDQPRSPDRRRRHDMTREYQTSRRAFLALAAAGAAAAALPGRGRAGTGGATNARIVIIGAGAAGTALANRLVDRLEGAQITLIDPRAEHLYQPGLTLVAAG